MKNEILNQAHPEWYWKYYDLVFGRGNGYDRDCDVFSTCFPLTDAVVQEIGSGKGDHAQRLLDRGVRRMELVDNDKAAICLLNYRFNTDERVSIVEGDGFRIETAMAFDVVLCMYSVAIQKCDTMNALICRINRVVSRLESGGIFAFEVIDYEASQRIYPSAQRSELFNDGHERMFIESHYLESSLQIQYTGVLENAPCSYSVCLLRVTAKELCASIRENTNSYVEIAKLDPSGRRLLIVVRKPQQDKCSVRGIPRR